MGFFKLVPPRSAPLQLVWLAFIPSNVILSFCRTSKQSMGRIIAHCIPLSSQPQAGLGLPWMYDFKIRRTSWNLTKIRIYNYDILPQAN